MSITEAAAALSAIRNVGWLASVGQGLLRTLRPPEPALFDCVWFFYDVDPALDGRAVGEARLKRSGFRDRVRMDSVRTHERTTQADVRRSYVAEGTLRDRRLVLAWEASRRPAVFGAIVLALNADFDAMEGFTVYASSTGGPVKQYPIWYRKARTV